MWLLSLVGIEVVFIGQNVVEASELSVENDKFTVGFMGDRTFI